VEFPDPHGSIGGLDFVVERGLAAGAVCSAGRTSSADAAANVAAGSSVEPPVELGVDVGVPDGVCDGDDDDDGDGVGVGVGDELGVVVAAGWEPRRGVDPGEQVADGDGAALLGAGVALGVPDGPGTLLAAELSAEPPLGCVLPGASCRISAPVLEIVRCSWVRA
jgi:hypothetical protein